MKYTHEQAIAFSKQFVAAVVDNIHSGSKWPPVVEARAMVDQFGELLLAVVLGAVAQLPPGSVEAEQQGAIASRIAGIVFCIGPAVVLGAGMDREVWLHLAGAVWDECNARMRSFPGVRVSDIDFAPKQEPS